MLVALAQTTSHVHAMFMHHIVAYACVWLSAPFFSIGPAPETDPEYLSEEQCSARCFTRQANPLVHSDTTPLSLLLPVIALGQQRLHLLLYAAVVEPIPLHDLSSTVNSWNPLACVGFDWSHDVILPCLACYCLECVRSDSSGMNWSEMICSDAEG